MEKEKIIFDVRTPGDFMNLHTGGDENQSQIQYINKEVHDFYFQRPQCYTCKLELEEIAPPCLLDCRFKMHPVNSRNSTKAGDFDGRAWVDTRNIRGHFHLLMNRYLVSFNHHKLFLQGYNVMLRPGNLVGFHINHINKNWYDDRPENLEILTFKEHGEFHSNKSTEERERINKILTEEFKNLYYEWRAVEDNNTKIKTSILIKWSSEGLDKEKVKYKLTEIRDKLYRNEMTDAIVELITQADLHARQGVVYEPDCMKRKINYFISKGYIIRPKKTNPKKYVKLFTPDN